MPIVIPAATRIPIAVQNVDVASPAVAHVIDLIVFPKFFHRKISFVVSLLYFKLASMNTRDLVYFTLILTKSHSMYIR